MRERIRELDGAVVFVIVTVALTLLSAKLCIPVADTLEPSAGAMLRASVLYVAVVGWQPLVAFAVARRWPGLLVHGLVWGLCYSPLFAVTGASLLRSLGYVVTCALLGVVLGWLRLSTRSIYASAASNATLTICAGLPLLLVGEASRFSAAFEPPGWLPLVVVILLIAWHRPSRNTIEIPWRRV